MRIKCHDQIKKNCSHYAVTIMMLSTGIIYFVAASETGSADSSASVEITLFVVSGCAYIGVGLWMVKSKENRIPYLVARRSEIPSLYCSCIVVV